MAYNLLLVNGDDEARGALARQLALFGEPLITEAGSAREALEFLGGACFDALIVEADLPDMSGGDLCWLARRRGFWVPVLVLGDDRESTLVLALESGADDYLGRPFGPSALLARLRLQLRPALPLKRNLSVDRFVFFSSAKVSADFDAHRDTPAHAAGTPAPRAAFASCQGPNR
jgi:DNA-binding response OmpR family regulator